MIINTVALDDEPLALELITDYTRKIPYINLLQTFANPLECLSFVKKNRVDLLLLDIQMDDLTGFQVIDIMKDKPIVIFTTAYVQYAVQSWDFDAVDYLLKPFSFERFIKAIDKAYNRLKLIHGLDVLPKDIITSEREDNYIFIKTEFRLQKVNITDILFIEGMGDYLRVVTTKERIMTLQSFKKMEEALPESKFCRVHKSYIVAFDHIISIEKNHIKISDKLIPISDTYRKKFFDQLEKKKLI